MIQSYQPSEEDDATLAMVINWRETYEGAAEFGGARYAPARRRRDMTIRTVITEDYGRGLIMRYGENRWTWQPIGSGMLPEVLLR
jgi:hypothetical protein